MRLFLSNCLIRCIVALGIVLCNVGCTESILYLTEDSKLPRVFRNKVDPSERRDVQVKYRMLTGGEVVVTLSVRGKKIAKESGEFRWIVNPSVDMSYQNDFIIRFGEVDEYYRRIPGRDQIYVVD